MKKFTSYKNKLNQGFNKDKVQVTVSSFILLFLWQCIAIVIDNDIYLPTIGKIFESIVNIIYEDSFTISIVFTILRTIISFLIALMLSVMIGVIAYINNGIKNFFKPINVITQSIPMMILIVIALIWFDKENVPFIVGTMIAFPVLYECVLQSMQDIDISIIEMANIYKVSLKEKIISIYFPSIKFRLFSIIASTISLVLKIVIAGEIYGQPKYGIGAMIQMEKVNFNTPAIFGWIIIILMMSLFLEVIQKQILRSTFIWKR